MPSFITPARLAALVGVLTGLGAAATSLLKVLPVHSAVSQAIVGGVGVIGTIVTVAKFLEGQAGWEQLQATHKHEAAIVAQKHANTLALLGDPAPSAPEPSEPEAELPDEVPLNTIDEAGVVINEANPETGEPQRLYA